MNTKETVRPGESDAAENMESEMEERDESRHEDERAERQDLNQGMDTGTHDSGRRGVRWGTSYRIPKRGKTKRS